MRRTLQDISDPVRLPDGGSWQTRLVSALALDVLDFILRGAMGLRFGFPVGGLVGLKLAHALGWRDRRAWKLAALCGVYCMIPGSEFLPIGTASTALALLVGATHRDIERVSDPDPMTLDGPLRREEGARLSAG